MAKRNGLFIVAGPTGSGKTTTLYACLEQLKDTGLKILSVEDPVEYHFDHVNQVQIADKEGRSFADALRSFLRHDPDVILVGEIRDSETAKIAVEAALQGHLVLATLHAIDVARVRTRMMDMRVEPFQLDATLAGSMAQRLVRLLCKQCKAMREPETSESKFFLDADLPVPEQIGHGVGCSHCRGDGYLGRKAVAELTWGLSGKQASAPLKEQGLNMVARGETSLREVISLDVD
jgi:general secretion pathway protein E